MASLPETKYARSGDINIAYQVMGSEPMDLVVVPGIFSHVEFAHEIPGYTLFFERLASFARVITFDKRGNGLSDRAVGAPSLETRMDDVRAVMDAVGSEKASLLSWSEGCAMSALFTATHPERISALVLYASFARILEAPDCPRGITPEFTALMASLPENWGRQGRALEAIAPSVAQDAEWRALWAKFERLSASPGAMQALVDMDMGIDVRSILPNVRTPTLVLHRRGDAVIPFAAGEHVASLIPGARFVALDGNDHQFQVGDVDTLLGEIEEFLTGQRRATSKPERVLVSVLFTDIVGSTERARELGDRRWRELLDSHDRLVARQLERFRGKQIKHTGDGILATFDGAARAVTCAAAIREDVRSSGMEIRAGLHTGEVELRSDDIGGIAVHIAARVLEKAAPGEILVSRTLTDLVAGSELRFEDRGEHELKGVAEKWHLFSALASSK